MTSLLNIGLLEGMNLSSLFDFLCLSKTLCFLVLAEAEDKGHAYTLSYVYIWEAILDYSSHETHCDTGLLLTFKPLCNGSLEGH